MDLYDETTNPDEHIENIKEIVDYHNVWRGSNVGCSPQRRKKRNAYKSPSILLNREENPFAILFVHLWWWDVNKNDYRCDLGHTWFFIEPNLGLTIGISFIIYHKNRIAI